MFLNGFQLLVDFVGSSEYVALQLNLSGITLACYAFILFMNDAIHSVSITAKTWNYCAKVRVNAYKTTTRFQLNSAQFTVRSD